MPTEETLRQSPLANEHQAAGAKMVAFAGWSMPVRYEGVMDEHRAVRSAAGLFDVSHMGEVRVSGTAAEAYLQYASPNDVSALEIGEAHYTSLLTDRGTYVDDLLIYRLAENDYLLVINAANTDGDLAHLRRLADRKFEGADLEVRDESDSFALLALQGPEAEAILAPLCTVDVAAIGYYHFGWAEVAGRRTLVSRTGYTGEDGFELYVAPEDGAEVWRAVMSQGEPNGLVPAGLGARDTLRTEAAMALYGHEIDDSTTPYEARLAWTIKLDKGDFVGREALLRAKAEGLKRKLVGFEVVGRGIAREGCAVVDGGETVGSVTSGTFSPTLERAIGMAYVPKELAKVGRALEIDVRGRPVEAVQVKLPFYRRETA